MHKLTVSVIAALVCSVFSIASTSIGIKTFNDNTRYKQSNKGNFNFLVFCLVIAILFLLLSFFGMYLVLTE